MPLQQKGSGGYFGDSARFPGHHFPIRTVVLEEVMDTLAACDATNDDAR
jgi:hypothetical protein